MTKNSVIAGVIGVGVGLAIGYFVGKKVAESKSEKYADVDYDENVENPEGVDLDEYYKEMMEYKEVTDDVNPEPEKEETKEDDVVEKPLEEDEDVRVSGSKHHGPKILGDKPYDEDDPSLEYEHEYLHYFVDDDILTDGIGHEVNENVLIGPKPRQIGFMRGKDGEDILWVRNYDYETDYCITREDCSVTDMFEGNGKVDDE